MPKRKTLVDRDGEVRELTVVDFKKFKPMPEVLSPALQKKVRGRGPAKAPTKQRITIRLSQDVVRAFRAGGAGWQTRVDAALKDWLQGHA